MPTVTTGDKIEIGFNLSQSLRADQGDTGNAHSWNENPYRYLEVANPSVLIRAVPTRFCSMDSEQSARSRNPSVLIRAMPTVDLRLNLKAYGGAPRVAIPPC